MADEIIRVKNSSYSRYEELLMRRDAARKESFQLEREYVKVFGDLILKVFEAKIECIRKKKTIEYCQTFVNRGQSIDQDAMQEYLRQEMVEYQESLENLIKDNEASKYSKKISQADLQKIKKIYHKLVKNIHPDINPVTNENEELKGLWQRLMIAYNCNDLKEMQETEILINKVLDKLDMGTMEVEIPDIEDKIEQITAEIEAIKSVDPYQYKFLLEDDEAVESKKEDLRAELKEYEDYGKQLDEVLEGFVSKGAVFTWRMN